MPDKVIKVYKAKDGWRWHKRSGGDIVADSGEAYTRKAAAVAAANQEAAGTYFVVEVEDA